MYQLTENPNQIIRLDDGASIPRGHRWWDDYEAWLSAGNTPQPAPATFAPYVAPVAVPTLSESQSSQISAISMDCGNEITSGFTSSALGSTYTYPSKMTDQMNLIGAYGDSLNPSNPSTWTTKFWCADSTGAWALRVHTSSQIQQVFADGVARKLALIEQNDLLASQVMAATTVSAVQKIIWVAP